VGGNGSVDIGEGEMRMRAMEGNMTVFSIYQFFIGELLTSTDTDSSGLLSADV
jgi:hypothetical protein